MTSSPRILIVTAPFGEGHNSAARNLKLAFDAAGVESRVCDPCLLGAPHITDYVNRFYRMVTTYSPQVWSLIYRSADHFNFNRKGLPALQWPEHALEEQLDDLRPTAVVSTFPLYPYFLPRIFEKTGARLPVFTVVTDSIEINAAWLRLPTDWWLVTDSHTRDGMAKRGIPAEKIVDAGFAVNPIFSELSPLSADDSCDPFRVLYFPTANLGRFSEHGRALLEASPSVRLTIVLGRNVRRLYSHAWELKKLHPGRVHIRGWTRKVPQLLSNHHLVVGKAGGATVHEAIAARCPMLIHHLVPGQEEGNLQLLETIGGGALADTPEVMTRRVADLLADRAAAWRDMKHALARHGRNAGAITSARFVLQQISNLESQVSNPRS